MVTLYNTANGQLVHWHQNTLSLGGINGLSMFAAVTVGIPPMGIMYQEMGSGSGTVQVCATLSGSGVPSFSMTAIPVSIILATSDSSPGTYEQLDFKYMA